MVLDSILVSLYLSMPKAPAPLFNYYLFVGFVMFFLFTNYIFLKYVISTRPNEKIGSQRRLVFFDKLVVVSQIFVSVVLITVIVQIHLEEQYSLLLSLIIVFVSHLTAIGFLIFLVFRFIRWLSTNRNYLILLYAYAFTSIIIYLIASLLLLNISFSLRAAEVQMKSIRISFADYSSYGTRLLLLSDLTTYLSVISFVSTWVPSALLLRNYSRNLRKFRFWALASLPLLYFIVPFLSNEFALFDNLLLEYGAQFNTIYYMLFGAYRQVGGLLFGIVFWVIAYKVERTYLKKVIEIAGIGMTILFGSSVLHGLANIVAPPFGLVTISFMGLGSYMLMMGILSASVILSRDTAIRREIFKIVGENKGLLGSIGIAEMSHGLEDRINVILDKTKDLRDDPLEPLSKEMDYKKYLEEVLTELKSKEDRE